MKQVAWIAILIVGSLVLGTVATQAQTPADTDQTVTVSTQGELEVWPDQARMKFQIQRQNLLAARAVADVRAESLRFREVLKKARVETPTEVAERGVTLSSQNEPYRMPQNQPSGFTAANEFVLKFPLAKNMDVNLILDRMAEIVDLLNPEGFTPLSYQAMGGPYGQTQSLLQFVVSDPEPYTETCMQEAMQKNEPEAQERVQALGMKITGLKNSNIGNYNRVYYRGMEMGEENVVGGIVYKPYKITADYNATYRVEKASE